MPRTIRTPNAMPSGTSWVVSGSPGPVRSSQLAATVEKTMATPMPITTVAAPKSARAMPTSGFQ